MYEAERADGAFDQRVAVKLLRRGLDTDEIVRRFIAERQILSDLEHPNIARLIDGGAADDGRPFLVMERVQGEPIVDWADRRQLTIRERLRLFLQVAEAVQFAHRRLIIHRDLKPSNILVDDSGNAKLLDFGIAKLLDPEELDETLTRTGVRPLTPAFASPEQIRGERVTTASDVFQLGVLLYLLLSGRRPFGGRGAELEAAITTGRLPRPSDASAAEPERTASAASAPLDDRSSDVQHGGPKAARTEAAVAAPADAQTDATSAASIARARRTTPDGLARALRGDLDAIILMALRTEPERRYASASDLAEDIARFLAREPVLARPDTLAYRARRFASRRPGIVGVGLTGFLMTGAYVVTLNVQAERLAAQRDLAQTESEKATLVSDFLVHLLEANDPDAAAAEPPSVFDLLQRGEERVGELDPQPAVKAKILSVMGNMYALLGRYDRAEQAHSEALELRQALHVEPHADLAISLSELGDVLQRVGRYDEAGALLEEAIETSRRIDAPDLESDAYTDIGHIRQARGDFTGAEEAYAKALDLRRELFGERHERTATSIHNLALALESQERFDEAEQHYLQALDITRELLPPEHSDISLTLTTLARLYTRIEEFDKSESLLREALDATRKRLGPRHARLGLVLNELGFLHARQREWSTAEQYFVESLEINEASLGPTHSEVASALNNLSFVIKEQGRLEDALPLHRRALEVARVAIGEDHQNTGFFAYNLGFLLEQLGRDGEAEPYHREAIAILERALPEGHALTTRPIANLGDLLTRNGRAEEAEPLLRTALDRRIKASEPPAAIADVESMLGACLAALGRLDEGERLLEKGLATLEQTIGPDRRQTQQARARLDAFRGAGGG